MLKKWIDEIRKHPDLYKTDSWKYHISGNVIEISILPIHLKDKNAYRCAVIAVGRVLKALSCKIEKQQSNFHIQSFPTLENPAVVASIRMDENREFLRNPALANNKSLKKNAPEKLIRTLAKQYQLDIRQIQKQDSLQMNGLNYNEFNSWFALYSTFNNPFTWLNVGYWKESFQNECYDQTPTRDFRVIDFCHDNNNEDKPDIEIPQNKYLQSVIGLNVTVKSS